MPLTLLLLTPLALQQGPTLAEARTRFEAGEFLEAAGMLEELTRGKPDEARAWLLLGHAYHSAGEYERALPALRKATQFPQTAPMGFYNAACAEARLGRVDAAFRNLFQAEGTGRIDLATIDADPDLVALREDPRFRELRPPAELFAAPFVEPVRSLHVWDGEQALSQFGWIGRNVGDVDGDGRDDFVTSAPTFGQGRGPAGRVYVYSSGKGTLLWQVTGEPGDQLGLGVEAAGDVDGDGVPDVVAGAPGRGLALVYSGKDGRELRRFAGVAGDGAGTRVAGVGDLDRDGCAEVVVTAPGTANGAGLATVHSGKSGAVLFTFAGEAAGDKLGSSASGGSGLVVLGAPDAGAGKRGRVYVLDAAGGRRFALEAEPAGAELGGMFVSVLGDLDADGTADVYASDWSDNTVAPGAGRIYVHSGRDGKRLLTLTGEAAGDGFGIGPGIVGDVDRDGHADLVVGAWQHARAARSGGKVYLHSGKSGALLRTITCRVPGDTFGFDATGLGDVDGDGEVDLLVTSGWSRIAGSRSGRVFVLAGTPSPAAER